MFRSLAWWWCIIQVRQKMERVKMIMIENVNQVRLDAASDVIQSDTRTCAGKS